MKQYIVGIVLLSLTCFSVAFKEEDCEGKIRILYLQSFHLLREYFDQFICISIEIVCVATIREFADTLTDDVKSDPKKIEEAFKEYCLSAKSKQQRLVCTRILIANNLTFDYLWSVDTDNCVVFCSAII